MKILTLTFALNLVLSINAYSRDDEPAELREPTVRLQELKKVSGTLNVLDVQAEIQTPEEDSFGNPTHIALHIQTQGLCGDSILGKYEEGNVLTFFQLGRWEFADPQPDCDEVIEFRWEPSDFSLEVGQNSQATLLIGPHIVRTPNGDGSTQKTVKKIRVTTDFVKKMGPLPGREGDAVYFEYSNVTIEFI